MKAAVADRPDNSHTDKIVLRDSKGGEKSYYLTVVQNEIPSLILVCGKSGEEANGDSEVIGRLINTCLGLGVKPSELAKVIDKVDGGQLGTYHGRVVKSKAEIMAQALRQL